MNYRGLVLASKGQNEIDDEGYEKEDENIDTISRIYF